MLNFYKPLYNPTGLTGLCGSSITTGTFNGVINEIFCHVSAPPSGSTNTFYQYRKVYVKNNFLTPITTVGIYVDAIEHPEQIHLGVETGANQMCSSPTGAPTGVTFSSYTGYQTSLQIGALAAATYTGIWIRQTLSGITQSDPYATFRLYAAGVVT